MSHLENVFSLIIDKSPIQAKFLDGSLSKLSEEHRKDLGELVQFYIENGMSPDDVADSYLLIVEDTLAEQIYFRKNKRYRHSSFNEVKDSVYNSERYMKGYMVGLALSLFLWPNHNHILKYFVSTLPTDSPGNYLEIGPGHGVFLLNAMENSSYSKFFALDISEQSLVLTRKILTRRSKTLINKAEFICDDFLAWRPEDKFEAVVMGEVLEHVEKPQDFLEKIFQITNPDSYIYITTCINAPAIDHIYLFSTIDDVKRLISSSGFVIVSEIILPYEGKTLEETVKRLLPINVGFVLKHA